MAPQPRRRRPYAARVPMAERREQLLDAALEVIDRDGYDKVSVDAVAKEAGVTRPVVYGAFDGLGALLLALLDRQQQRALAQLYAALPLDRAAAGVPLPDLVTEAGPALHRMLLADPATWRVILSSPASLPDVVRDRVAGDREQVRLLFEQLLPTPAPPGADAELWSHALLAVLEHLGRLVLAEPERFGAERVTGAVRAMLAGWAA